MEPKIIDVPAFKLAGLQTYGVAMSGQFAKMWALLMDKGLHVPDRVGERISYGVCSYAEPPSDNFQLFYMAAVPVSTLNNMSPNVVGKIIPANTYAVFTHKGALDETLKDSFHGAYNWLAASDYERAGPYDLEFYGPEFKGPENPDSILEIHVPVKKKG